VSALASQQPGVRERYRLTEDDVAHYAWVIEPSGRRHRGAAAIARVLDEMGGGWRLLGPVARLPGAGLVYALVDRTRDRLSAVWGDPPPYPE